MTPNNQEILINVFVLFINVYWYHTSTYNWAKPVYMTCGIMITRMLAQDVFLFGNPQ